MIIAFKDKYKEILQSYQKSEEFIPWLKIANKLTLVYEWRGENLENAKMFLKAFDFFPKLESSPNEAVIIYSYI